MSCAAMLHADVTVLTTRGPVAAKCSDVFPNGAYMFVWNTPVAGHIVHTDLSEGVLWIRGHHDPDSKEIAALRVSLALGIAT